MNSEQKTKEVEKSSETSETPLTKTKWKINNKMENITKEQDHSESRQIRSSIYIIRENVGNSISS